MSANDLETATSKNSANEEEGGNQNVFHQFIQMEELFDKLKLIDHETYFKSHKMRPINRHYFALQTNSGEQFFVFSSLCAWLIRKCGLQMESPQEHDDPNSVIASILEAARNLGIFVDFPPNKLKQGVGKFVILLLNNLCDGVLHKLEYSFLKPVTPVEVNDEEIVIEDDSELLLERIEEEMAAEEQDTEDDEDVFLNVDDLNKINFQSKKTDEVLQSNITNEEWQLEMERVMPSLKLTIRSDDKDWRSHIEHIKQYRTTIGESMKTVRVQLDKLTSNITETMDKVNSREKFLNSNLDSLLMEYRAVQEQLAKINSRFRELNGGVTEKQRKLAKISEELELVKQEMEERGTFMTDGTPLINIKKALTTLKEDVANMNVQIGILQHDILHSKMREKLLMQQKFHSQVYA